MKSPELVFAVARARATSGDGMLAIGCEAAKLDGAWRVRRAFWICRRNYFADPIRGSPEPRIKPPKDAGDMWGMSVAFWEMVFRWATIAALLLGGLTATAAFISVWVGYQLTAGVQQDANRRISESQAEAARASAEAAKALERAAAETARAQALAGDANASATVGIAKMNAEMEEARKKTAIMERDASEARLEQLRLKALLAWRTLAPPLASALRSHLSAAPSKVNIEYVHSDAESQYFALQIANTFVDAKWNVGMLGVVYDGVLVFGIAVPESQSPEISLVRKAFDAVGIEYVARDAPRSGRVHGTKVDTAATIFVGSKPIPTIDLRHRQ